MRSKSRFTTLVLLETREIRSVCNRCLREDTTVPPWGAQCPVGVLCPERCGKAQLYDECDSGSRRWALVMPLVKSHMCSFAAFKCCRTRRSQIRDMLTGL